MWLYSFISLALITAGVNAFKDKTLTIGGIFPMNGSWAGGQGCLPAVQMALEDVNKRFDIIPNYRLRMEHNDSQCMPGLGTKVLFELLYNDPTKIMVLTGCSIVSTFVAEAAKMWNLVVLGYGSSSPALSDRKRFPTFFRTHPSATLHNPTRVKILQKFGWKKIATIQETQEVFQSTLDDLELRAKEADIDIAVRQSFLTDPTNAVRNLKRQDARIIIGVFYEDKARRVFCQVYKEKLYGKKYVWFIIGWYPDNWYTVKDPSINCTADQLKEALEGHFTTEAVVLHEGAGKTISGMTAQNFKSRLDEKLNVSDTTKVTGYPEAPLAYDAVWALALALNLASERLAKNNMTLEQFDYYGHTEITREIYSAMNSTRFLGVSGNVAFSSEGDRIALTQIEQMRNGTYYKLGYYDSVLDNLTWFGKEIWKGGKPPPDRTHIKPSLMTISPALFFAMSVLSLIGIIVGIACLVFNLFNKQRRCIIYSQPMMNNFIVIGCIICLLCVFLLGLDGQFISPERYALVCQTRAWLLSIGFTLAYGSMFSKTWTVHRLATMSKKDRKVVKSWELQIVLSVILTLDVLALASWQMFDPMYREVEIFEKRKPTFTDEDILLEPQLEHCKSENLNIWLGVVFGYKGILLLFGIFLAYETRSIKLKLVNDSRFVGMSIYNVVVLCVITAPISLIISNQQDAAFAFVALAIFLCSFISLSLIFTPKILEIIRNPQKGNLDIKALTDSLANKEEEEKHKHLMLENEQMKRQIAEMEEKVKELNRRLNQKPHQKIQFTALPNVDPPPYSKDDPTENRIHHLTQNAIQNTNSLKAPEDEIQIGVDANSDSGLASGSIAKSSKTSGSDFEPFC